MSWSPANGSNTLVHRLGRERALEVLVDLLDGSVAGEELMSGPYPRVLADIGDGHATELMEDPTGARLAHWPRAWAARSMAYVGDDSLASALISAIGDEHWRVRMNAISAAGRLGIHQAQAAMVTALDDPHHRVRSAALVALGRVGDESVLGALQSYSDSHGRSRSVDNALERVARRIT
jgi:HEAT repeat protein